MCAHTIADRYTLLRTVEGGNVSQVYRAIDTQLDQPVALKVLRDEATHDRVKRLQMVQEARAGAMIDHPRVVPIFDLGSDDGELYLVMPWIDGRTLQERLKQESVLEVDEALPIIQDVLAGLDAMHRLGWIHADLKPQNIILAEDGHATIVDLGCVWRKGESCPTADTFVVGSPASMPPEQIRGEDLSPATDVYAAGVMLFRMLTGRLPFQAATAQGMLTQQLHVRAPTPRLINPLISRDLEAALLRSLQKDPEDRFSSAEEMAQALQTAAEAPIQLAVESVEAVASEESSEERPRRGLRWFAGRGKRPLPMEQRTPVAAFSLR
jgi:serine/threonine-protein kinase